jgi:hypothetical protein
VDEDSDSYSSYLLYSRTAKKQRRSKGGKGKGGSKSSYSKSKSKNGKGKGGKGYYHHPQSRGPTPAPTPYPSIVPPPSNIILTPIPTEAIPTNAPIVAPQPTNIPDQRDIKFTWDDCSDICVPFADPKDGEDLLCLRAYNQGSTTTILYTVSDNQGVSKTFSADVVISANDVCFPPLSTCIEEQADVEGPISTILARAPSNPFEVKLLRRRRKGPRN